MHGIFYLPLSFIHCPSRVPGCSLNDIINAAVLRALYATARRLPGLDFKCGEGASTPRWPLGTHSRAWRTWGWAMRQLAGPARYYLAMVAARRRLPLAASTSLRLHDSPPVHSLLRLPCFFFFLPTRTQVDYLISVHDLYKSQHTTSLTRGSYGLHRHQPHL